MDYDYLHSKYCSCNVCQKIRQQDRKYIFGTRKKAQYEDTYISNKWSNNYDYDSNFGATHRYDTYKTDFRTYPVSCIITKILCVMLIIMMVSFNFIHIKSYCSDKRVVNYILSHVNNYQYNIDYILWRYVSIFKHADILHLSVNICSFMQFIPQIKFIHLIFAIIFTPILHEIILYHTIHVVYCSVGFSGVLFAFNAKYDSIRNTIIKLVMIQTMIPNASFTGHLSGIICGIIMKGF